MGLLPPLSAAPQLTDWESLGSFVTTQFDQLTAIAPLYPPGIARYGIACPPLFFDATALHTVTNTTPTTIFGVPAWTLRICETETTSRLRVAISGNTPLYYFPVPYYEPQAWTRHVYGTPPDWLDATALEQWYRERARSRIELALTLIPKEYQAEYLANRDAALANALPRSNEPRMPHDTNRVAFARISATSPTTFSFDLYTPSDLPIDIFTKTNLAGRTLWHYAGTVQTTAPFTPAALVSPYATRFLHAARGDIDSDGDGIPDGMERLHFGTNPYLWDSSGDGLSDWLKIYRYGLDPLQRDSDGDGYPDDEELQSGSDPTTPDPGAHGSIRYYYDEDDQVVGTYVGADGEAVTVTLTPAGNPSTLQERGAP